MQAYIYNADIYCKDCGEQFFGEGEIDLADHDSDEFPVGPFDEGGGESDSPQHCGNGPDCVNALILSDGSKVGCWLENPLTKDGVQYVRDAISEGGEVASLWAEWYRDELGN